MSNVIYLKQDPQPPQADDAASDPAAPDEQVADEQAAIQARNEANRRRLAQERAQANKAVLRSYRIKH